MTSAAPAVQHVVIDEASEGQRLDNFLVKLLKGVPKTHLYRVIRSGEVRVNKGRAAADTRLSVGDQVRLPPVRVADRSAVAAAPAREFAVVFEDDHLLVIDKPAGVAVHGGSGVAFGVIEQLRQARPAARFLELVHRLDKETSGLLMIAKKRSALVTLQEQLRLTSGEKTIAKTYAALVIGDWPASRKVIDVALHKFLTPAGERRVSAVLPSTNGVPVGSAGRASTGKPLGAARGGPEVRPEGRRSITLVNVAERLADGAFTLLDVTIKTGRTHQIRVHLTHEGHPIVGDAKYGDFGLNKALARGERLDGCRFDRMFLHARYLRFAHPVSGEPIALEAPMPAECSSLLRSLAAPARDASSA